MEKYVLMFNNSPEFIGTKEECVVRYNKHSERMKRYCQIRPMSDNSHNNRVDMTKHHSSVSYDTDGDVAYYY